MQTQMLPEVYLGLDAYLIKFLNYFLTNLPSFYKKSNRVNPLEIHGNLNQNSC